MNHPFEEGLNVPALPGHTTEEGMGTISTSRDDTPGDAEEEMDLVTTSYPTRIKRPQYQGSNFLTKPHSDEDSAQRETISTPAGGGGGNCVTIRITHAVEFRLAAAGCSIVAVHGLNGDAIRTWTTNKTEKFWLADPEMLPKNMSNARILSFGYDASATAFFGRTSSDTILQHAHTLVAELVADRQLEGAVGRPIIFICHSLGGIVVKRVCNDVAPDRQAGRSSSRPSRLWHTPPAGPAS
ncbi:MAG: hypothetical protein LQ344_002955 [Seirophora lacunosa]|nr:MAG: hypothetical protein LQ344_002955 [Seirophora lacunosa]